jgi:epoxyqueuosine reductase QueG
MEMGLELGHDIRELILSAGADFFGVADLARARDAILEQGGELVAQFPRAIAIGIALPHSIIDLLPQRTSVTVARRYEQLYVETNQRLDQITARVISKLQQDGFAALAVRASLTVDPGRLYGVFANKMAAHLAACEQCVEACPPRAFTGKAFRVGEHRDVRFAAWKCSGYLAEMKAKMGCRVLCGLCVSVCPHGKRDDPRNHRMESDH